MINYSERKLQVTVLAAAQNRARELFHTNDPCALHKYLQRWKDGEELVSCDFVLSVIHHFDAFNELSTQPPRTVGWLTLNYDTHRALWKGHDLDLTVTEFKVVAYLVEELNRFMSYRAIYDVVHYQGFNAGSGEEGFRTNVRSIVKRMRRKFDAVDPMFTQIENFPGMGYRWRAPEMVIMTPINGTAVTVGSEAPRLENAAD